MRARSQKEFVFVLEVAIEGRLGHIGLARHEFHGDGAKAHLLE
jgi:hypothetical protein